LGYRFTCALTGYFLNTTKENMVEAAHIHQHADSGNDDPRNGLALTPDAHWLFDRDLWTAEAFQGCFAGWPLSARPPREAAVLSRGFRASAGSAASGLASAESVCGVGGFEGLVNKSPASPRPH
jgi:hypothetical protein